MFRWFGKKKTPQFVEDFEEARTAATPVQKPVVPAIEEKEGVQTSVSYFTVIGGDGNVYLNALIEATPESVKDVTRILANMFSLKVQSQTLKVIRENLVKSERADLVELFDKELVAATVKKPTINTETGEEEPCVSPSDLMT